VYCDTTQRIILKQLLINKTILNILRLIPSRLRDVLEN